MKALTRRLHRLEEREGLAGKPRERLLVVVSGVGRPLNLAGSTCRRRLAPDGSIVDHVHLDGSRDGLTDDELDRFIECFPIEAAK
jgi:hypothetical protein